VNARHTLRVNAYQLLVAIGRFTAADLRLPVALYDPNVYYHQVRDKDGTLLPPLRALDPNEEEENRR
jgi:hypothetical protein